MHTPQSIMINTPESAPQRPPKMRKRRLSRLLMEEKDGSIMQAVRKFVRQQMAPLKKAINIILKKLDISISIYYSTEEQQTHPNGQVVVRKKRGRKPKSKKAQQQQVDKCGDIDVLDDSLFEAFDDSFQIDPITTTPQVKQDHNEKQFVFQPRGNNSSFNPSVFPQAVPFEGIKPEHRQQWQKIYRTVKRLVEGKTARKQRGWFDFQKKILLQFVIKGSQFGSSLNQLTMLVGVSHSTFKRWLNYFK